MNAYDVEIRTTTTSTHHQIFQAESEREAKQKATRSAIKIYGSAQVIKVTLIAKLYKTRNGAWVTIPENH